MMTRVRKLSQLCTSLDPSVQTRYEPEMEENISIEKNSITMLSKKLHLLQANFSFDFEKLYVVFCRFATLLATNDGN